MAFEKISLQIDGGVALLKLNHPEVMNAVSLPMLDELGEAMHEVEDPANGARCLLLTGEGRAFCAGANLQQGARGTDRRMEGGGILETHYHPLLRRLRNLHCPVVTAVNGAAAGVGMSIALMGDIVLCARSAYFLQAFRRIGLVPDGGSTWLLPRLIGRARAIELSLLGERLPAETALQWGLVNRVTDDAALMDDARAMAQDLATGPTVALGLIRRMYWESPENSYEQQLDLERQSQRTASRSADAKEGVTAFREKRPAQFRGD